MKSRNSYLLKNTLIFAIGSFATKFISFFLVPLYTNILSPSEYGIIDLIYAICTILVPFFTLNISESIMRFSLDKNANKQKITNIGTTIFTISIIFACLLIPLTYLIPFYKEYSLYIFLYFISLAGSQIYLANLKGQEKLVYYTIGNIIHTFLIAFFNILFLVVLKKGIEGYFLAYILSNFTTTLYSMIFSDAFTSLKEYTFDKKIAKEMIKYSVVLIPTSFMWWIMNSSDRIMVSKMISTTANGIYAISYKIPSLISTIVTTFTQAWLFSAIKIKDDKDNEKYTNEVYNNLYFISFICGIGIFMILKHFLKFYVSKEYFDAWKYIPFLIIGVIFQTLASFISTSYNVNKDNRGFLFSGLLGAILNIILNFIFIPFIGIYGAALATCLSYISVYIYRLVDTKKYVKIHVLKIKYIISYILLILSAVTVYINSIFGQLLLILEFIITLVLFRSELVSLVKSIAGKYLKRKGMS